MHSARMVQTTPRTTVTLWSFRLDDETTEEVGETRGWVDDEDGADNDEDGVDNDEDGVDDDEDGVDSDRDMELVILEVVDAAWKIVNSSD